MRTPPGRDNVTAVEIRLVRALVGALVACLALTGQAAAQPEALPEGPPSPPAADPADDFDPTFGPMVTIEAIRVVGNRSTAARVIVRTLPFLEGERMRAADPRLSTAKFKVLALGYFRDVSLGLQRGLGPRGAAERRTDQEGEGWRRGAPHAGQAA